MNWFDEAVSDVDEEPFENPNPISIEKYGVNADSSLKGNCHVHINC